MTSFLIKIGSVTGYSTRICCNGPSIWALILGYLCDLNKGKWLDALVSPLKNIRLRTTIAAPADCLEFCRTVAVPNLAVAPHKAP